MDTKRLGAEQPNRTVGFAAGDVWSWPTSRFRLCLPAPTQRTSSHTILISNGGGNCGQFGIRDGQAALL